jgi:predicted glycogen debranching enzyme
MVQKYWEPIKSILDNYYAGTDCEIKMTDHCLIYMGLDNSPQTWMDAMIRNKPVTHRKGYAVEVNALWYNAVCFAIGIAKKLNEKSFLKKWEHIPAITQQTFLSKFWVSNGNYLADYCTTQQQDESIRPNQIIAAALPFSPLNEKQKVDVINCVKHKLLTKKGLRTLSPADARYKPYFHGSPEDREMAYHQGTVHPWLLEFYAKALVSVYKKDALPELNKIFFNFEEDMLISGIGTINEVYDGDPPHQPRGAISQAWSLAALLQIKMLMDKLITNQIQ